MKTLLVKTLLLKTLLVGLLMMVVAGVVWAGEAVDKTLAVKPDGLVRIENVRGRIDVEGWERSDVRVVGTLDDQAKSLTFETSGSTTTVKVETPDNLGRGKGSDLVIHVPTTSRVRVEVVSADLVLQNLHGGIDAQTVSGGIDGSDLGGRIELATVSGDVDVTHADGAMTFNSVSGNIKAETDAEQLRITTVSGGANVRSSKRVKEMTLNSVSGDIDFSGDLADGARVKGATTSGDVRLAVNRDAGAVVELRTTAGGAIKNTLTSDRAQRSMAGGEELEVTMGDGAGSIELTTVSGRLELSPR